jgi:transposase
MPNERLTMRKIQEILRLHFDCKRSDREIATSCSVARSTVSDYVHRAQAAGLGWPLPDGCDEAQLEKLLFPSSRGRPKTPAPMPDWAELHEKLKRKGMTLALLWERYKKDNPDGFQYSHFCDLYRDWHKKIDVVMRQNHRAGEKLFSDFAGSTLLVTNPHTGEVLTAHLFVAVLGASSFTYAEAFWSENCEAWCTGHANAFAYMNGVTEIIVPDNPRAAVNKPSQYEPDLHVDFHYMANFFGAAVIPARVRKPRDKAKVEAAVKVATMWIIAALKDRTFFSLAELNKAISELLEKLNNRPFKKMPGSRRSSFESIDKPALKPLPEGRYEYTKIGYARAGLDYHINVDGYLYSVPYEHAKQKLEYRLTATTLEVFFQGRRIASHPRLWIKGRPSTLKEHMPSHHKLYQEQHVEWTPIRITSWAMQIGPAVADATSAIMSSKSHPEQGFRACLGVIRLARTWGNDRVDIACQRALSLNACSYKYIKLILESGGDLRPTASTQLTLSIAHDNVRGSQYYSQSTNEENSHANTPDNRQSALTETNRHDSCFGITDANA